MTNSLHNALGLYQVSTMTLRSTSDFGFSMMIAEPVSVKTSRPEVELYMNSSSSNVLQAVLEETENLPFDLVIYCLVPELLWYC